MNCPHKLIVLLGLAVCPPFFFSGCFSDTSNPDYSKLGLVEISGVVTLDGEPLDGAAVYFHDRPNRRFSYGVTDSTGRYSLMFDSRMSGVMPGEKEIEITTTKNPSADPAGSSGEGGEGEDEVENGDAPTSRRERVPARYNVKTELTYNVTGSNDQVNFDLNSTN